MSKKYFLLISACEIPIAKYSDNFIIYLSFLCTDWSPIRHYQIAGPTIPVVLLTTYFEGRLFLRTLASPFVRVEGVSIIIIKILGKVDRCTMLLHCKNREPKDRREQERTPKKVEILVQLVHSWLLTKTGNSK